MVVVVNGGADSGVVLVPLISLDFAVTVLVTEVLEELHEDLVLGDLAGLDLRVHAAVVDTTEVSGSDFSITVGIELEEGLVDHSLSLGVEASADADEELIEVDVTIAISVEKAHESVGFGTGDADLDLAEARVEFFGIDFVVAVEGVKVSEGPAETSDSLGTAGLDLCAYSLENYRRRIRLGHIESVQGKGPWNTALRKYPSALH